VNNITKSSVSCRNVRAVIMTPPRVFLSGKRLPNSCAEYEHFFEKRARSSFTRPNRRGPSRQPLYRPVSFNNYVSLLEQTKMIHRPTSGILTRK